MIIKCTVSNVEWNISVFHTKEYSNHTSGQQYLLRHLWWLTLARVSTYCFPQFLWITLLAQQQRDRWNGISSHNDLTNSWITVKDRVSAARFQWLQATRFYIHIFFMSFFSHYKLWFSYYSFQIGDEWLCSYFDTTLCHFLKVNSFIVPILIFTWVSLSLYHLGYSLLSYYNKWIHEFKHAA